MRKTVILFIIVINTSFAFSQNINGKWSGVLELQGTQLPLVFNISTEGEELKATMDSPAQNAKGIPVTNITFSNPVLTLKIAQAGIEYKGTLAEDKLSISGTFKQAGREFPLDLSKGKVKSKSLNRPQEPIEPFDYYTEDVVFTNTQSNITLSGTLTLPNKSGRFPLAILISGSGPQNRDGEVFNHKPFLVIADYLARSGIATLRYDDRGVGQSEGHFTGSNSKDFAQDVESAISFLKSRKEVDSSKIGLIGHSEGGMVAAMVASSLEKVKFMVLLASPGMRGDKLLLKQQRDLANASGIPAKDIRKSQKINRRIFKIVLKTKDKQELRTDLHEYLSENIKDEIVPKGMKQEEYINIQLQNILNPWMLHFIKYNPVVALMNVTCPVMALNGGLDLQVSPDSNLKAIEKSLKKAGNKNVIVREYDRLNHLFQECTTGLPNEYSTIEQTFSPAVLSDMSEWLLSLKE
jgi:uncharacterized protein